MTTLLRRITPPLATIGLVAGALGGSPGWAAPPDNDDRAQAQRLSPPQTVSGTLVEATVETQGVDDSDCEASDASVWYRFTAPKRGAIVIELDARGDMDATVDLFEQVRSRLSNVDCASTDRKGIATIDTDALTAGEQYAIRVGKQSGSVADAFTLRVAVPSPPPVPPGKPLPSKGVKGTVDRLTNSGDAFSTGMFEGRTMRLSLRTPNCTRLEVYGPGTRDFDGEADQVLRCGGFSLFTPTETGRHFLVVSAAGRSRGTQRYKLRVAPAGRDDTTPGIFIRNNAKVSGKVNGGIDFRDLYRFDVTRRSTLTLSVTGDCELRLVREDGARFRRGSFIEGRIAAGRYFVAVEGTGRYTLRRVSRTITRSTLRFDGRRSATISPGGSARLALRVSPAVNGNGVIAVERLDPIDGWQFLRRYRLPVRAGSASVSFSPPSVGLYRAYAAFKGTGTAASSETGIARLKVRGPLVD